MVGDGRAGTAGDCGLLAVEGLTVSFGGVTAVREVSVRVGAAETVALIGPNGAGKTTLFDAVAGQNRPSAGRVYFSGQDISGKSALWRSRNGIRRTFQRQQTFPGLSVEDNVLVALEWDDFSPLADVLALPGRRRLERERRGQVGEALNRVGLYGARSEPAFRLPLGQSRLLEVARAIVSRPRLLLLDEPTSGMETADIDRLSVVLDQMKSGEDQCGVVLVEHDVQFAMAEAERVYVMHLGQVIAEGTPAEVQANDLVIEIYLGSAGGPGGAPAASELMG